MAELNLIRDQPIMLIYAMLQCLKFNLLCSILCLIYFIILC